MRATTRVLLVCVLAVAVVAVAGCATGSGATSGPVKVGESENGTTVNLTVGQTLEISLPANPTTGFDWLYGAWPSQLTSVSDTYETTAGAGVVGAGGMRTFVLKATSDGTAQVRLGYARPWESVPPEKTFELTVVVRKPGV
jgi:predicted secreted protein